MRIKSIRTFFVLMFAWSSSLMAGNLVWGLGVKTCSEYLTDRDRTSSFALSGTAFDRYGDWAHGYISGIPSPEQPQMEITHATIIVFLDDYCRKNALERLYSGIESLTKSAIKKSRGN